ncbi:glycine-rich domain-containing protein [Rahnella bonaserana]
MANNNFKPFAVGSSANVISQTDYEALAALIAGFTSGKASSAQINKALRQGTVMSSVLAQFISDTLGVDVLDNGVTSTILANLKAALLTAGTGRLLNVRTFTSSGAYTPTAGTTSVIVEVQGAGGGGGYARATSTGYMSAGAGGGAGGYGKSRLTTGFSSVSITIGTGGTQGVNGGSTSFGSLIIANGGGGGLNGTDQYASGSISQYVGASGGTCTGANIINYRGGTGGNTVMTTPGNLIGGVGGTSYFTASAISAFGGSGIGVNGLLGSGGGGAISTSSPSTSYAGGNGGNGLVVIWEYA